MASLAPILVVAEIALFIVISSNILPLTWQHLIINRPALTYVAVATFFLILLIVGLRGLSAGTVKPFSSILLIGINGTLFTVYVLHLAYLFLTNL